MKDSNTLLEGIRHNTIENYKKKRIVSSKVTRYGVR